MLVAFKRLARPLVRFLIANGIQLPAIVAALKQVYVDVAVTDFRIDDSAPTDSRVSVLTGVHRRDVSSIRRDGAPGSMPSAMSLPATVIGRWMGDPDYADENGKPRVLPWSATDERPNFEQLVRSCSKDVHPRTILDELLDQHMIDVDETNDVIALTAKAFVPTPNDDAMVHFFEMNLHDHLAAATSNITGDDDQRRFLEQAVYYNSLLPESIDELETLARERAGKVLRELNSEALRYQDADRKTQEPTKRFRFGVFFYSEDDHLPTKDDG